MNCHHFMKGEFNMFLKWLFGSKGTSNPETERKIEEFSVDMAESKARILKVCKYAANIPPLEEIKAKEKEENKKTASDKIKAPTQERKQAPNSQTMPIIKEKPKSPNAGTIKDAMKALKMLGYKEKDIKKAIQQALNDNNSHDAALLVRSALKQF